MSARSRFVARRGAAVVCPLHAWKIDLSTGRVERPETSAPCLRTYPTRLEGDIVAVQWPSGNLDRQVNDEKEDHAA